MTLALQSLKVYQKCPTSHDQACRSGEDMEGQYEATTAAKGVGIVTEAPSARSATQSSRQISRPEFTLFPELAPELRHMIWKKVCFQPRNVDIWATHPGQDETRGEDGRMKLEEIFDHEHYLIEFKSHSRLPPLLHTSSEARKISLEYYALEFGLEVDRSLGRLRIRLSIPSLIYFNWECDIICPMSPKDDPEMVAERIAYELPDRVFYPRHEARKIALDSSEIDEYLETGDMLIYANFEEIIIYYVPETVQGSVPIYKNFDPETPFHLDFIPIDDYISESDYLQALVSLQKAKDVVEKEVKLGYAERCGEDFDVEGITTVVKLMVLKAALLRTPVQT
jgi:hypothetical protein